MNLKAFSISKAGFVSGADIVELTEGEAVTGLDSTNSGPPPEFISGGAINEFI